MKTLYINANGNRVLSIGIFGRYFTFCDNRRIDYYRGYAAGRWQRFKIAANPFPVYYSVDSRDCDHCRTVTAHKATSGRQYLAAKDEDCCFAEGPTFHTIITRAEYESFESSFRDYIGEAFDNGESYRVDY
tara:strand:+ start:326 stop:718 length:393 start_codon:yes stop_codon:yes gene_type:complete